MKRLIVAVVGILIACGSAIAQIPGNFPAGTVFGNSSAAARPGRVETTTSILDRALCSTANSAVYRNATVWACLPSANNGIWITGSGGIPSISSTLPPGTSTTASAAATSGFRLPHGTAPTSPVNGDFWTTTAGAFIRINSATLSLLTSPGAVTSIFVQSRAFAQTINLTGYTTVMIGGYAAGGDGCTGRFKNVGATALLDTGASFTDAAGNNFQYVAELGVIDVRCFGYFADWNTTDVGATDNTTPIQRASTFAALTFAGGPDVGGGYGKIVWFPPGTGMVGSSLIQSCGVTWWGAGPMSTILKVAIAFNDSDYLITQSCGGSTVSSFGNRIVDMQIFSDHLQALSGRAVVISTSVQHTGGLYRVKIFAGNRTCVKYEDGFNGATYVALEDVECTWITSAGVASVNPGISVTYGGFVPMRKITVSPGANPQVGSIGLLIGTGASGGPIAHINGVHCETSVGTLTHCVRIATTSAASQVRMTDVLGGTGITNLVSIANTVPRGSVYLANLNPNTAAVTILDEGTGTSWTGNITQPWNQWTSIADTTGVITNRGSTSGAISFQLQAAAGTYNWNWPTSAGTTGLPLLSGGGGASPMTFGVLGLGGGGSAKALTAVNGGVVWSDADSLEITAAGVSGQLLQSNGSAAPTWTTATYPVTAIANRLLYVASTNVITDLATANNGVLVTSAGGVPSISSTLPPFTLGGAISGGGNQVNNVIIGATTPLAGTFTAATANSFVPNSSAIPTNGLYLRAANQPALSYNSTNLVNWGDSGSNAGMTIGGTAINPRGFVTAFFVNAAANEGEIGVSIADTPVFGFFGGATRAVLGTIPTGGSAIPLQIRTANTQRASFTTVGGFSLGPTELTLTDSAFGMNRIAASGTAPGASGAKMEVVCGTNAGTAKLVIAAGTSGTAVTIVDNVGAGVTGC